MKQQNREELYEFFSSKEEANYHAHWMTFKYRRAKLEFGVVHHPSGSYASCEVITAQEDGIPVIEESISDLSGLQYRDIRDLRLYKNPHEALAAILGIFSGLSNDCLMYILHAKIPLEKMVRDELTSRGRDQNGLRCDPQKAYMAWIPEDE